ncbi:hypothetical protein SUGI_0266440 [Cryptomeria japonica]|nr:hypothetical protein SUGI_0266440 [Cryptomeria japonica]
MIHQDTREAEDPLFFSLCCTERGGTMDLLSRIRGPAPPVHATGWAGSCGAPLCSCGAVHVSFQASKLTGPGWPPRRAEFDRTAGGESPDRRLTCPKNVFT